MINFRRKIGIILVVAVSAAAILAVPASAAPKTDYFDYSCQGTVVLEPWMSEEQAPSANNSCTRDFTVKPQHEVWGWVETLASDNFTGSIRLELFHLEGTVPYFQYGFINDYVAGEPVGYKLLHWWFYPGDWRMTVTAQVATVNPSWYDRDGPDSYVTVPASAGGFGGHVSRSEWTSAAA